MKVAIIEGRTFATLMPEGPKIERRVLGPGVRVLNYGPLKPDQCESILCDIDAAIVRPGTPFPRRMVSALKRARVIVSLGAGYDHICLDAAREKGITVCNVPDYCTKEVADSTIAMLLAHQRKIFLFGSRSNLNWDWRIHIPVSRSNVLQAGIIGLGRIGKAVAIRLKPFGHKVTFYDPYLPRGIEKSLGLQRCRSLNKLLKSSDIVTLHTPLTEETAGMVDGHFLRLLKPNVILLNTARGGIFKDADTIYRFLRNNPQARIGSDVWPEEPPRKHPLLNAWKGRQAWLGDRLILCPHTAFYSEGSIAELRFLAAKIVKDVLRGKKPHNVVSVAEAR